MVCITWFSDTCAIASGSGLEIGVIEEVMLL
jgi:hypothetical protein